MRFQADIISSNNQEGEPRQIPRLLESALFLTPATANFAPIVALKPIKETQVSIALDL